MVVSFMESSLQTKEMTEHHFIENDGFVPKISTPSRVWSCQMLKQFTIRYPERKSIMNLEELKKRQEKIRNFSLSPY